MSSPTIITDHADQAIALLIEQFKSAENLQALIGALIGPLQEIENTADDLYTLRAIDTAEGEQLDGIGEIVNEERQGRDDDEYREGLYFRILVNNSKSIPETIIDGLKIITGATKVTYIEIYPAKVELMTDGPIIPDNLHETIESILPAGVGIDSILWVYDLDYEFHFRTEYGPQEGKGFAELNTSTGLILVSGGQLSEVL